MMKKSIIMVLSLIITLSMLPFQAFASERIPADQTGSITLTLQYKGKPIKDGSFYCIQVADVISEDANYYFRQLLNKDVVYRDGLPELKEIYDIVTNPSNAKYFKDHPELIHFEKNRTGTVKFKNLDIGLYLIIQKDESKGFYKMNHFLVSVPYEEDGKYKYDVNACIKHELKPEIDPSKPPCDPDPKPTTPCPTQPNPNPPKPSQPKPPKRPQTGQLNWPVPVLAVSGMALFLLGWWLTFGRKKDTYDA